MTLGLSGPVSHKINYKEESILEEFINATPVEDSKEEKVEAIYVRAANVDSLDGLKVQIEKCRKLCANPKTARIYSDLGYSANNIHRPGLRSMLVDIENREISTVILHDMGRISPHVLSGLFFLSNLFNTGVELEIAEEEVSL